MQNEIREKLIELIMKARSPLISRALAEKEADYLIANGVIALDTGVISHKNRPLITRFAGMPMDDVLDLVRAKQEGRIIVLPCKVGAIVYLFYPVRKGIYEAVVDEIYLSQKSKFIVVRDLYFNRRQSIFFEQIGKTVFLTKEEAEKALKERENNGC